MQAGHEGKLRNRRRFIPVHTIAEVVGRQFCLCLPAMHAIAGCDTTSAYHRIVKRSTVFMLLEDLSIFEKLSDSGNESSSIEDRLSIARPFVMKLYGYKQKRGHICNTLDDLRYQLSVSRDKAANQIPPTEDYFRII